MVPFFHISLETPPLRLPHYRHNFAEFSSTQEHDTSDTPLFFSKVDGTKKTGEHNDSSEVYAMLMQVKYCGARGGRLLARGVRNAAVRVRSSGDMSGESET